MNKKSKILITGASGYQAAFIVRRLRPRFDLTLFDRIAPSPEFADLRFVEGDITRLEDVETACAGQAAVVHLVALVRGRDTQPLGAYIDVMVKGTWNVAEACARQVVLRLINISSVIAHGMPPAGDSSILVDDGPSFGRGDLFYCLAKHLGEVIGNAYHQAHGLQVLHLRPAMIARDGANPEPEAGNHPPHWFMHVDPLDVAQGVERALDAPVEHGAFNIVATRPDALFNWRSAREQLGYSAEHLWHEVPLAAPGKEPI